MIDDALLIEPSIGSVCNAFDHMWGYFKNVRMKKKDNNQKLLKADFINGKIDTQTLLDF